MHFVTVKTILAGKEAILKFKKETSDFFPLYFHLGRREQFF